jgi:hypothetical protein
MASNIDPGAPNPPDVPDPQLFVTTTLRIDVAHVTSGVAGNEFGLDGAVEVR